jgi:hypothetical protein
LNEETYKTIKETSKELKRQIKSLNIENEGEYKNEKDEQITKEYEKLLSRFKRKIDGVILSLSNAKTSLASFNQAET